jgi:hypothetical protein
VPRRDARRRALPGPGGWRPLCCTPGSGLGQVLTAHVLRHCRAALPIRPRDRAAPSGSTGAGAVRTAGSGDNSSDAGRSLGGLGGCVPNRRGLELRGPGRRSQLRQGRYGRFVPPADRVLGPLRARGCTAPAQTPSGLARSLRRSGRTHGCCPDTGRRSLAAMRSRYPSSMCVPGHRATGGGRAQRMPPRLCRASTRLRAAPRTPLGTRRYPHHAARTERRARRSPPRCRA